MNQMRDLIAVLAGPLRIAALGVLSAGLAAGATLVLVDAPGRPPAAPALSLRTAEARPATPAARPSAPPEAQPEEPAPQPPAPVAAPRQTSTPPVEQDDSGEPGGDD